MEHLNQEPSQDTFEVEISDLSIGETGEPVERHPSTRLPSQARLSPRAHARRSLLEALAFLLMVGVILGSQPTVRNRVVHLVQRFIPTPTPTLVPGADRFYIATDVPWAKVTLDGRPIALPRIGVDAPLQLARGRHVLAWTAAPFQPQQCFLSVPPTTGPSCFVSDQVRQGQSGLLAQVVVLGESLTTLPAKERQMLLQTTQAALSGFSDTVRPGETYFLDHPGGDITTRALVRATLHMQVQTDNASSCTVSLLDGQNNCTIGKEVCATFCTVPWQYRQAETSAPERQEWLTFGTIHSSWDYADANGKLIAGDQPVDTGRAAAVDQLVLLRIAWNGAAWQVQPLFGPQQGMPIFLYGTQVADDPGCLAAEDIFTPHQISFAWLHFISGPNPAAGCLVETTFGSPGSIQPPHGPIQEYLIRFGAFIAVNTLAQQVNAQWVPPDAYEQQLARQLAALPGGLTDP
jgi:hypothetical protein